MKYRLSLLSICLCACGSTFDSADPQASSDGSAIAATEKSPMEEDAGQVESGMVLDASVPLEATSPIHLDAALADAMLEADVQEVCQFTGMGNCSMVNTWQCPMYQVPPFPDCVYQGVIEVEVSPTQAVPQYNFCCSEGLPP